MSSYRIKFIGQILEGRKENIAVVNEELSQTNFNTHHLRLTQIRAELARAFFRQPGVPLIRETDILGEMFEGRQTEDDKRTFFATLTEGFMSRGGVIYCRLEIEPYEDYTNYNFLDFENGEIRQGRINND